MLQLFTHRLRPAHYAADDGFVDHCPDVRRVLPAKQLLPLHADVDHVRDLRLAAPHLRRAVHCFRVRAGLEQAGNVHAGVVVLPDHLVLQGQYEVHGFGDRVGERMPPALDPRALGEFDKCSAFLVARPVLTTKRVHRRPFDSAFLPLVAAECGLGDADPSSRLFEGLSVSVGEWLHKPLVGSSGGFMKPGVCRVEVMRKPWELPFLADVSEVSGVRRALRNHLEL